MLWIHHHLLLWWNRLSAASLCVSFLVCVCASIFLVCNVGSVSWDFFFTCRVQDFMFSESICLFLQIHMDSMIISEEHYPEDWFICQSLACDLTFHWTWRHCTWNGCSWTWIMKMTEQNENLSEESFLYIESHKPFFVLFVSLDIFLCLQSPIKNGWFLRSVPKQVIFRLWRMSSWLLNISRKITPSENC